MDFYAVLDQVLALLHQRGRVSYRALKRQFDLDDAYLDDLKVEIIEVHQCAVDQEGTMLVWTGKEASAAASAPIQLQAPLAYTPAYLAEKILTSRSALEGERKQVTVLFADLKGSTELICDLDPEAAQHLLDPALQHMMDAAHRFEGTVNQVLGDGIMALFGAPIAHEDHALRACYAALAMQAELRRYAEEVRRTQGLQVQLRVGLNSGDVVVRTIGNDLHMDYSAVGQTTHLAARMEQLATPGTIRLPAATLRLVEGLIRVTPLGPVPVKGLADPVEIFELVGASALRGRFQARVAGGLTRFVGRDLELAALRQILDRDGEGHGQVVVLVGEAGVGKSRLVYECVHSHHTQGWRVLESASVSYGKATPYCPVIDLLKRYCHVDDADDARTIRTKVTGQVLTLDETLRDTLPALLALLDVLPNDSPFHQLDPRRRRQRTLDALTRVFLRESQVQPLLLVFEDLHWIDSETQALLDRLVESLPTARLLLLVNYRPEYQHGWGSKTYYAQLRLDALPPASAEELLAAVLGDDPSVEPLARLLIARTEGNPFFLEESMHALVETGVLVCERGAYRLAQALPTMQVPATVQAILAARIDRLPPEDKRLLQTAAVIGIEVPLPLLQAIAEVPEAVLYRSLSHLQAAEFLYETCLFPAQEYIFKHALTHEVAYGSLLLERRRALHARIVEALETLYPERLTDQIERLAYHAFRGEVWEQAVAYCRQAGAKALERSAYREAVAFYEQALEALQQLPETRHTLEQAIDLRFDVRNALWPLGDQERLFDYLCQAESLAETLDDQHRLGSLASFMIQYFRMTGDDERAITYGQRARAIATTLGDLGLRINTNQRLGRVYYDRADYRQAIALLWENLALLQGDRIRERFGTPNFPAVLSRAWLVLCLAEYGEFAQGSVYGGEGIRLAEALADPYSQIHAYSAMGGLYLCKGDLPQAIDALQRSLGLYQTWNFPLVFPSIASQLGYAYALAGRMTEALPLLEQAVTQITSHRSSNHARWVAWLSEAYLWAGRREDAVQEARRTLELCHKHAALGHQAWVLRLFGTIHAYCDAPDVELAAASYRQALAFAEELEMRPLQAHCHRGLGTLYVTSGQREQARAELSAAIELYCAMEMTFWLPQAETALAQVEER